MNASATSSTHFLETPNVTITPCHNIRLSYAQLAAEAGHLQGRDRSALSLLKVTKQGYVATGHDNNMVATKAWGRVPFTSRLQCNREQLSSVACKKKKSVKTPQFASARIENDSGVFPLEGEDCSVSPPQHTHTQADTGPHWSSTRSDCSIFTSHHLPGRRNLGLWLYSAAPCSPATDPI